MIYTSERDQLRQFYADTWKKAVQNQPLDAMETLVAQVIELHPEYHQLLTNKEIGSEYLPEMGETNPFLHMGLHLGLHEQVNTDRPAGIQLIYKQLMLKSSDTHEAEHQMMECLAESLWQAQKNQQPPNEQQYLDCLKKLV